MVTKTKHGLSHTPLWRVWRAMKTRCYRKKNENYKYYGGRGISVCDEWRNDSKSFFDWALSHGYRLGLYIDRIDNNGNYTPENCRFTTPRISCCNVRKKSSLPTGVRVNRRRYCAQMSINKKRYYLGIFKTSEEAGKTYRACVEAFVV